jgi:hypothetical protein
MRALPRLQASGIDEKRTGNMPVKFSKKFKNFLKSEASISQGAVSEGVPAGFINYGEWFKIWQKACQQFPDCSEDDFGELDKEYAFRVRQPRISLSHAAYAGMVDLRALFKSLQKT